MAMLLTCWRVLLSEKHNRFILFGRLIDDRKSFSFTKISMDIHCNREFKFHYKCHLKRPIEIKLDSLN